MMSNHVNSPPWANPRGGKFILPANAEVIFAQWLSGFPGGHWCGACAASERTRDGIQVLSPFRIRSGLPWSVVPSKVPWPVGMIGNQVARGNQLPRRLDVDVIGRLPDELHDGLG